MLIYLLLLCGVCLTISGEILLKLGMNTVTSEIGAFSLNPAVIIRTFTEWRVVLGFALIFGGALFWLGVISRADLSFAYPLLAISYILILLPSRLILNEAVTPNRVIGALIVMVGVIVITWERRG